MNNQDIFDLMARFDASAATRMKLTTGNFTLELEKGGRAVPCARTGLCARGRGGFAAGAVPRTAGRPAPWGGACRRGVPQGRDKGIVALRIFQDLPKSDIAA